MSRLRSLIAVLLLVAGAIFIGQGSGILRGSSAMVDDTRWAWIGLGADGISSACYGPAETFLSMRGHTYLALILALMTALTVFIISTS